MKKNIIVSLIGIVALVLFVALMYVSLSSSSQEKNIALLSGQGVEVSPAGFINEVKAGHLDNIRVFLATGLTPASQNNDGTSALLAAVQSKNPETVTLLLNASVGSAANALNVQDKTGTTPLLAATALHDAADIEKLLAHGADVTLANTKGETPLLLAVKAGDTALAQKFLTLGQQQHPKDDAINSTDGSGNSALNYAIDAGNAPLVALLLSAHADAVGADVLGATPLMHAAQTGHVAIGQQLLQAGAKPNVADKHGNTPLVLALAHSHPDFVNLLLQHGATPEFHASALLHAAIKMSPPDAALFARLLANGGKLDETEKTALLFEAVDNKAPQLLKYLLDAGFNVNVSNEKGETLLYHAIDSGVEENALLILDHKADKDTTGIIGMTPLERAAKKNQVGVVARLLALGVSANRKTSEGYSLAEMAVYQGYPEILDDLLKHGATIGKDFGVLWSIRDGKGKAVPVLLAYGANPNVMSQNGDAALYLAAVSGEEAAVSALIKAHAELDYPNHTQAMTALGGAAQAGQLAIVHLLAEAGAGLEKADSAGMTPLAHAAYTSHADVVEYLLHKGANPHAKDKQGRSAVDFAALASPSTARDKVILLLKE